MNSFNIPRPVIPEFENPAEQAAYAIDRSIVDGINSHSQRVTWQYLATAAGLRVPDARPQPGMEPFQDALGADPRYIDHKNLSYHFRPQLPDDSLARPSILAIVSGRAVRCTDTEREQAYGAMERLATEVYTAARSPVVNNTVIQAILKAADIRLSQSELKAFWLFMGNDPRFHVAQSRVALVDRMDPATMRSFIASANSMAMQSQPETPPAAKRTADTALLNARMAAAFGTRKGKRR